MERNSSSESDRGKEASDYHLSMPGQDFLRVGVGIYLVISVEWPGPFKLSLIECKGER